MSERKPYRLNVVGPFYVEDGCCTLCGVPDAAPALFEYDDQQCYVKQQPRTPDELDKMLFVMSSQELGCEDRAERARGWLIDPFATGWAFDGWKERADTPFVWKVRETYQPIPVWLPKMWLLRTGWKMHGLIGVREVPGPTAGARDPMLVD